MVLSVPPERAPISLLFPTTSSSGTSAVWFEALVYPQTLGAEFYQSMDAILSSVNVYSLGSTVFDTPTTLVGNKDILHLSILIHIII